MAGKALEVTDGNFHDVIMNAEVPALVDFWAVWCGPCKMIAPLVDELAKEYAGRAVFAKVDVDSCPKVAAQYSIRSIPTVLFFKGGKVVEQVIGAVPKKVLVEKMEATLKK